MTYSKRDFISINRYTFHDFITTKKETRPHCLRLNNSITDIIYFNMFSDPRRKSISGHTINP